MAAGSAWHYYFINSSFAPLNNGGAGIVKAPIDVKGVNRDSYIIFFQGI
ncbi:MAG: hypothetical protein SWH54_20115 [Thermodesulfobacteriota bacterium]|nr:hypothetical protein [Thermodesulfobacteriota bacterium]